jgi:hypothetical protein
VRQLYDQLKSARYQIGVAADRLEETVNLARGLAQGEEAEVLKALTDISEGLSAAGSKIADYDEELPPLDKFRNDFDQEDENRLKAIDACNAGLAEIKDQLELIGDLLDSGPPEEEAKALNTMKNATEEARDALVDAIGDMDGQVQ